MRGLGRCVRDPHLVLDLARERGVVLRVELREREPVAARRQDVAALERHQPGLDPADPLVEIGDPGGLAHLPVVDDVDPRLGLAAYNVPDRVGQRLLVGRRVVGLAVLHGREEVEHLAGTSEAAGVRRQDPVHQGSSPRVRARRARPGARLPALQPCRLL